MPKSVRNGHKPAGQGEGKQREGECFGRKEAGVGGVIAAQDDSLEIYKRSSPPSNDPRFCTCLIKACQVACSRSFWRVAYRFGKLDSLAWNVGVHALLQHVLDIRF
jgi:hypothetical protein